MTAEFIDVAKQKREVRKMRVAFRMFSAVVSGIALAVLAAATSAADLPKQGSFEGTFGWFAVGKTFELEKGHIYWVGEFSGTTFNGKGQGFMHNGSLICPGSNDIYVEGGPGGAEGHCIFTDADGDKIFSAWSCKSPKLGAPCDGTLKFTAGSGKYEGISGGHRFHGYLLVPTASGYSTFEGGSYKLP